MEIENIRRICVFCGSSSQVNTQLFVEVKRLGAWLAQHGIELIYGAGNVGLMGALADSVLAAGGKVTGVIPRFMVEAGWHHEGLNQLFVTNTMHERKQMMCDMSDAVVAFPGGIGTAEELLETLTWKQLGLITKPIVIMNVAGCYNELLAWLSQMVDDHFMREVHKNMWKVCTETSGLADALVEMPAWDSSVRKIAAI